MRIRTSLTNWYHSAVFHALPRPARFSKNFPHLKPHIEALTHADFTRINADTRTQAGGRKISIYPPLTSLTHLLANEATQSRPRCQRQGRYKRGKGTRRE